MSEAKGMIKNMDNTNSKEYWNDYVTYWENRVREANEGKEINDRTSNDGILEIYYKKLDVKKNEILLDYGCGSGRLYAIYRKEMEKENNYFGIDISGRCLEHAAKEYMGLETGKNLKEFDGLHIPFDDNSFDKILCFGVFDACNQEKIIQDMFRVLKSEGKLLVTGKNKKYFADDEAAAIAEVNARKKGHPNYFTDVKHFTDQLLEHKAKLLETYYFLRRGDFPCNKAVYEMPEVFYEWAYIVEKTDEYRDYEYKKFSDKYSDLKYMEDLSGI